MRTKLTTPDLFAVSAAAALMAFGALVLAWLVADFVPAMYAHPTASLVSGLLGAAVLRAMAMGGEHDVTSRCLAAVALVVVPLLVLAAGAMLWPLLSGVALSVPDLGFLRVLRVAEVPGVVVLTAVLLVGGVVAGRTYTHGRADGLLVGLPLALLVCALFVFAAAGSVPGLPGASEPHVRAGAQHLVVEVLQPRTQEASGRWNSGASSVAQRLTQ